MTGLQGRHLQKPTMEWGYLSVISEIISLKLVNYEKAKAGRNDEQEVITHQHSYLLWVSLTNNSVMIALYHSLYML